MLKYLPSVLPLVVAVAVAFGPQLQALLAGHPAAAAIVGALYAVLAHALPSPVAQSEPEAPKQ